MTQDIEITIRTAQGDRRVACDVGADFTVQEVLDGLRAEWNLPADHDYVLRHVRTQRQLAPGETLAHAGMKSGDELELFPILVAGASGLRA